MKHTYQTGLAGELTAEEYLCSKLGMTCIEKRFRAKCGEIDLIMLAQNTVVFVEVKTRKTGTPGAGLAAVDIRKQQRIARAAMCFLMNRNMLGHPVRFDVIEICSGTVIHIADAFQPGAMFYR